MSAAAANAFHVTKEPRLADAPSAGAAPENQRFRRFDAPVPAGIRRALRRKPLDIDPVARAESELGKLQNAFPRWLEADVTELRAAWHEAIAAPDDMAAFPRFHRAVHTVRGNAPILGCDAAGLIATPLAHLLERSTGAILYDKTITLAIDAIGRVITCENELAGELAEAVASELSKIVGRHLDAERKTGGT